MSEAEIEAVWYVRLPGNWTEAPEWMSFSRLREIEACPHRWSLTSASYPEVWSRRGYPPKVYLAPLAGQIIHAALETIITALNRAGCVSVKDENFVCVMRELGGYTRIIEGNIKNICNDLQDNPRFTVKSKYISTKLRDLVPSLREQLQILTGKLRLQGGALTIRVSGSQNTPGKIRPALSNGTYSEIELRADQLRWRGFADSLTLLDASCELVDYKTGTPKPEHEEQIRLYSLLWARDAQLNPKGRAVDRLTLSYPTMDIAVEPLTYYQLDILEQEIISRTHIALELAQQVPPMAKPNIKSCGFCPVRQLCDDYWTPRAQQLLDQEASRESSAAGENLIDLEVNNLEQQTPLSWSAIVFLCRAIPARSHVLIKLSESNLLLQNIFNTGRRIRILDALLIDRPEDVIPPCVHLTKMSEAFIV
jgi:CRISPR/Cas system-associated exonuclease Cas4 (RecB family)